MVEEKETELNMLKRRTDDSSHDAIIEAVSNLNKQVEHLDTKFDALTTGVDGLNMGLIDVRNETKSTKKDIKDHMDNEDKFFGDARKTSYVLLPLIIGFLYFVYNSYTETQKERDLVLESHMETDVAIISGIQRNMALLGKDTEYMKTDIEKNLHLRIAEELRRNNVKYKK